MQKKCSNFSRKCVNKVKLLTAVAKLSRQAGLLLKVVIGFQAHLGFSDQGLAKTSPENWDSKAPSVGKVHIF